MKRTGVLYRRAKERTAVVVANPMMAKAKIAGPPDACFLVR